MMSATLRVELLGLGMVVAGLVGGWGCAGENEMTGCGSPDGAGGIPTGDGGSLTGGTGGSPTGDGGSPTGGAGGAPDEQFECNENLNGVGGGIFLFGCEYWLGEEDYGAPDSESFGSLDVTCGEGGAPGHEPALRRLCEGASRPDFNGTHPIHHCLFPLIENPCASTHESEVRACVTQEPPCEVNLDTLGCTPILEGCAEVDVGTCYWAMMSGRETGYIAECFGEEVDGESCGERFLRCAWGL